MQLIEISEIEKVIENLEARANRRREDALSVPPLGPTYTGMAFVTDELVAELKDLVRKHAKTFNAPTAT